MIYNTLSKEEKYDPFHHSKLERFLFAEWKLIIWVLSNLFPNLSTHSGKVSVQYFYDPSGYDQFRAQEEVLYLWKETGLFHSIFFLCADIKIIFKIVFSRLLLLFSLTKLAMHVPTDHRIDLYWDWNVNRYPAMELVHVNQTAYITEHDCNSRYK